MITSCTFAQEDSQTAAEPAQAQEQAELKSLPPGERFKQPISLNLNNIDVLEALKYLAGKSGINVITTKNVTGRVTLNLENVPIRDIFDLILRSNGLAFVMHGDVYQVMSEAEYKALYGRSFSDTRKVRVMRLHYAIPEQIFTMLDALKSEIGRVLIDQESGNILIMDTDVQIARIESALAEFERQNLVEVFVLKYASAKDVEEILKGRLDAKKVGTVKADERSNQVIVQTFPDRMDEVRALISKLDRATKQVLVDTKIIKIKLSDQNDRGVQWQGLFETAVSNSGPAYAGSTPFVYNTAGQSTAAFTTRYDWYNDQNQQIGSYPFSGTTSSLNSAQPATPGKNLHFGLLNEKRDFDVVLNYLDTIGQSKVLANPRLVIVNNQEAKIHIGEKQAYVTTTTTSGQTTSTIAEEVSFVDVGIQLSVTPVINDDGYITMKVKPEISNVGSVLVTPTNNRIPIIDTTLTETTVMMKEGTTLLIGGLRKDEKSVTRTQLPFFGSIPALGNLFSTSTNRIDRTEILVMITPHIVTGDTFTVEGGRQVGEPFDGGYRDYRAITSRKDMLPGGIPDSVAPKPYRAYMSLSAAKPDDDFPMKGMR